MKTISRVSSYVLRTAIYLFWWFDHANLVYCRPIIGLARAGSTFSGPISNANRHFRRKRADWSFKSPAFGTFCSAIRRGAVNVLSVGGHYSMESTALMLANSRPTLRMDIIAQANRISSGAGSVFSIAQIISVNYSNLITIEWHLWVFREAESTNASSTRSTGITHRIERRFSV